MKYFISLLFISMVFYGISQECPENDSCSVPINFDESIFLDWDCVNCTLDGAASLYFITDISDTSKPFYIREWQSTNSPGSGSIDINLFYVGNSYDYCDSISLATPIVSQTGVTGTIISGIFNETGKYIFEIVCNVDCPEIYINTIGDSCDQNSGELDGDFRCQEGYDIYDGFQQRMNFLDYDCWVHWYNLCLEDTTSMSAFTTSELDSAYGFFLILEANGPDSVNCNFLDDLSEDDFLYINDDYLINDFIIVDSIPPGKYLIGFVPDQDYSGAIIDIEFEFNRHIYPCNAEFQCPWNHNCENLLMVDQCANFNGFCDSCSVVSYEPYYFGFNITEDNSFIVINENVNSSGFTYTVTRWDSLLNICLSTYFLETVATGYDSVQVVVHIDSAGYYVLALEELPECPDLQICQVSPPSICESCIQSFAPVPGERYLIGAWVLDQNAHDTITSYSDPQIFLHFALDEGGGSVGDTTFGPYSAQGNIIDGWQRIEELFKIPDNALDMEIELTTLGDSALFDDIRVFPFNASMKTFVYDPVNMRLSAELDERHYATFYEYDEEGKLVRIKKETEKGVMTIQETKSNAKKE